MSQQGAVGGVDVGLGTRMPPERCRRSPAQIPAEPRETITQTALTSLRLGSAIEEPGSRCRGEAARRGWGGACLGSHSLSPPGEHDLRP